MNNQTKKKYTYYFISINTIAPIVILTLYYLFFFYGISSYRMIITIFTMPLSLIILPLLHNSLLMIFGRIDIEIKDDGFFIKSGLPPFRETHSFSLDNIRKIYEKPIFNQTMYQISDKVIVIESDKKFTFGRLLTKDKREQVFELLKKHIDSTEG